MTGSVTAKKIKRTLYIYIFIYFCGAFLLLTNTNSALQSAGANLLFPGAGALLTENFLAFFLIFCSFLLTLFVWFATGNAILPPILYITSTIFTYYHTSEFQLITPPKPFFILIIPPIFILTIWIIFYWQYVSGLKNRIAFNKKLYTRELICTSYQTTQNKDQDELSYEDLSHFQLLLDRALQPVNEFNGFEKLDQFQTAALRYQINFISYALSCAHNIYCPAFSGYMTQAQNNLLHKQEIHKIWKYWKLESLWGNFTNNPDPIIKDNIMYSGFFAAQIGYTLQSGDNNENIIQTINCATPNGKNYQYTYTQIIENLVNQYKNSDFGLLPCEPNWIYPLCNMITATAIRTHDSLYESNYWNEIKDKFQNSLEKDFITPNGNFISFRSAYTGFSPPQVGGTVMQAFPCFFLNALFPDIAQRQWLLLKNILENKDWKKSLWAIDVGNYGFSRASSYAATALAAREMGDHDIAEMLLKKLNDEHPFITNNGISYRKNASLWANANAFMAKINKQNSLQNLVLRSKNEKTNPVLNCKNYDDFLVAKAINENNTLHLVLHPKQNKGIKTLTLEHLQPDTLYQIKNNNLTTCKSDHQGNMTIQVQIAGKTALSIGTA